MMRALTLCLISLLAAPGRRQAQVGASDEELKQTLAGLPGIGVLVPDLSRDAERAGLNPDILKAEVELQLRCYGIAVLISAQIVYGSPHLYVNVSTAKTGSSWFAFGVLVTANAARAIPTRPPQGSASGLTWVESGTGVGSQEHMNGWIRSRARDKVNKFINLYLAANLRPASPR
jgi:hypothetical protein